MLMRSVIDMAHAARNSAILCAPTRNACVAVASFVFALHLAVNEVIIAAVGGGVRPSVPIRSSRQQVVAGLCLGHHQAFVAGRRKREISPADGDSRQSLAA